METKIEDVKRNWQRSRWMGEAINEEEITGYIEPILPANVLKNLWKSTKYFGKAMAMLDEHNVAHQDYSKKNIADLKNMLDN